VIGFYPVADSGRRSLRSAEPRQNSTFGDRSFTAAGPCAWNELPFSLRDTGLLLTTFNAHLKTYLFSTVFEATAHLWHLWFLCAAYKCTYLLTYLLTSCTKFILTFWVPNYGAQFHQNQVRLDHRRVDRQTDVTNAGYFTICPMLCYSNGTDYNRTLLQLLTRTRALRWWTLFSINPDTQTFCLPFSRTCNLHHNTTMTMITDVGKLPDGYLVNPRIKFKTATLTFNALNTGNPLYLASLLHRHNPRRA